jgi:hypothetical protein
MTKLRAGGSEFDSRRVLEIFLFDTASRPAMGTTAFYSMGAGVLSGSKASGREADRSPPSSVQVKNAWSYTSTPQYVFMAWLVKDREDLKNYMA